MSGDGVGRAKAAPGDVLRHPLIVGLLLLWALNDHVFKAYFANQWTGKISDFAGLAVFPLIPLSAYEISCALLGREPRCRHWVLWLSLVGTGTFMVGINISEAWANVYTQGLSLAQWPFRAVWGLIADGTIPERANLKVTMDPTDLWTLPALSIAWWLGKSSA
ncbi:MAG: hypothetical protein VX589_04290 [Myxococcota bacterium]|nr:hypothetical protein [Myxococcota bacterium]